SIKSKAKILIAWVDEAETVTDIAWKKLLPTVREVGSEIWVTWNREVEGSATDARFLKADLGDDGVIVELNWQDNPWFPSVLDLERERDLKNLPYEEYLWIWEGHYRQTSESQIFRGKYRIDDFVVDGSFGEPLHGLDFGFANDPTAAVRLYIRDNTLYVSNEAGKVGLELDDTSAYIKSRIPNIENYVIRADSARPESISYLKRHGLPRITGVEKGKGSVEDGIDFIRSFDEVVIHSSCKEVANEFNKYSYKIDKRTEDILPVPVDAYNHYIDAIRYALEPIMKNKGQSAFTVRRR
ncbi:MAG: PBSX family phage terminase large subunit, partial [Bacteroides sp.]